MELLTPDIGLVFWQVVIFLIVFWVLKTKAFGPIQAMLEERRNRIEAGEEKLKKISDYLELPLD